MFNRGFNRTWRGGFNQKTWNFFSSQFSSQTKGKFGKSKFLVGGGLTALTVGGTYFALADNKKADYTKVRKEIAAVIEEDENRGPTLVRLAWHASGTFSKLDKTGGSDGGTIRFNPEAGYGANNGLDKARNWLEKVKKSNPDITYADLYTLAGVVAIEEMNGPKINWRPGRKDAPDGSHCTPDGRLPNADVGSEKGNAQHIRDIFYRMGFTDREIVALIGAHSLGRAHKENSGYEGPWTKQPTVFSNDFYTELLDNKWSKKKWDGKTQFTDPRNELMMLPADLAFLQDPEFKKYVEIYAKDSEVFFKDFASAFEKLTELGVKDFNKSWWSSIFG